ncbi:glycosyltransferase family 4 protein [Aerococcus urinaeequi]|nr:glycosyltransferase family 4 protein [Aerococcus urinaeequi]
MKVLILTNFGMGLYNFRKEVLEALKEENHEVIVSFPKDDYVDDIVNLGVKFYHSEVERRGTNPLKDYNLYREYCELINLEKPDIIFTYTVKPNIYGGLAARKFGIPLIANITGLGSAVENPGVLQKLILKMYKVAFKQVKTVFFQNEENMKFFRENNIATGRHKLLPGSGVNTRHFQLLPPPSSQKTNFVFISRIMKEKGIDQYLEAAKTIKNKYSEVEFHICGFCEEGYESIINEYQELGIVRYHGNIKDIRNILKEVHCTIHPTYYPEGLSNVLLESAAAGRAIITTNRSGTREVIDDNVTGYLIEEKNTEDLVSKIEKFIGLTDEEKVTMGRKGREKIENRFDRNIVVTKYLNELQDMIEFKV